MLYFERDSNLSSRRLESLNLSESVVPRRSDNGGRPPCRRSGLFGEALFWLLIGWGEFGFVDGLFWPDEIITNGLVLTRVLTIIFRPFITRPVISWSDLSWWNFSIGLILRSISSIKIAFDLVGPRRERKDGFKGVASSGDDSDSKTKMRISKPMKSNLPDSRISIGEFEVIGFFEIFEVESFSLTDSDLSGSVGLVDLERERLSKRALFDFELEATELWRDEIFDFDVTVTSGSFRLLFFESLSFLCFSLFRLFERLLSIFKSFSGFFDFLSEVFLFRFRFFFFLSSSSVSLELDDELEDELEIDFAFFFNFFFFSLSFAFNLCLED